MTVQLRVKPGWTESGLQGDGTPFYGGELRAESVELRAKSGERGAKSGEWGVGSGEWGVLGRPPTLSARLESRGPISCGWGAWVCDL